MKTLIFILFPLFSFSQLIPVDKQMHIGAGFVIASGVASVSKKPLRSGIIAGIAAGIAKEAYDSKFNGNVESRDVITTAVGAVIGAFIVHLYKKKRHGRHHKMQR